MCVCARGGGAGGGGGGGRGKRGAPSFTQPHLYMSHVCIIQRETIRGEEIIHYTEELGASPGGSPAVFKPRRILCPSAQVLKRQQKTNSISTHDEMDLINPAPLAPLTCSDFSAR